MAGRRLLVIDKLVLAIPDDLGPYGAKIPATIDEALKYFLEYRNTAAAVIESRIGNFNFAVADYPDDSNPETKNYTLDNLVQYLQDNPEKVMAGMINSLIFDDDLGAFRNAYDTPNERVFQERKAQLLKQRAKEESGETTEDADDEESGSSNPYAENAPAYSPNLTEQLSDALAPPVWAEGKVPMHNHEHMHFDGDDHYHHTHEHPFGDEEHTHEHEHDHEHPHDHGFPFSGLADMMNAATHNEPIETTCEEVGETPSCDGCDEICSERCPDEPGVGAEVDE